MRVAPVVTRLSVLPLISIVPRTAEMPRNARTHRCQSQHHGSADGENTTANDHPLIGETTSSACVDFPNAPVSPNVGKLLDLTSLTGFAARWSVLPFMYRFIEATKVEGSDKRNEMGSVVRFGEGVDFTAVVVLCRTHKTDPHRALSIGDKIS
jgi:hypothetical protein